jgi:hypothetical protein
MVNNIGYMICEVASSEARKPVIVDRVNDRVVIEAILQDLNIKNRNGRYYSTEELIPQLTCERTMELLNANGIPGEAGHPLAKDLVRQQSIDPMRVSHYITKLWHDRNDIKGHVRAARGQAGDLFNDTVLDGIKMAFSLRALGTVVNTKNGAEVKNIKVITWDWVYYPSHKRAYQTGIVTESSIMNDEQNGVTGLFTPFNTKQVINFIKESSCNFKTITESFEFLYKDITMIDPKHVQLVADSGEVVVCKLEDHVSNEIMSYCRGFKY